MIRNSPLFIQKIMTLVVFSFFFSFLTSLFDVVGMEEEKISQQTTILFMLAGEALVGLIYFTLIYFCLKRKNSARVILVIFIIFGLIMYGYSLISAEYSIVQWIFYVTSMILDVYILILLLSKQANSFFKSSYIQNEVTGSYKAWFSTLSSILFVVMIGAKFLNKHEINQTNLVTNQSAESQPADEMAASEELEENNNQANEDTVEQDTVLNTTQSQGELLNDISGVWSDHESFFTFYYEDNKFYFLVDDESKEVELGDIDVNNKTINLLVRSADTNKKVIWTIRKVMNDDNTFRISVATHLGELEMLSFVREIGRDDKKRIEESISQL